MLLSSLIMIKLGRKKTGICRIAAEKVSNRNEGVKQKMKFTLKEDKGLQLKLGAAAVLLLSVIGANTIFAENPKEEFETIHHLYSEGEYLGAVSQEEPIEELVDGKLAAADQKFKELKLEPSEEFNVVTEQSFSPNAADEEEALERLDEQLAIQASAFALAVDDELTVYLKDREAYEETVQRLKLAAVPESELKAWEDQQAAEESLPPLKAGETRITDVAIDHKIWGATKQVDPENVKTPEQAAAFLLDEAKVKVIVKKEQKEKEAIDYKVVEKDDKNLLIGKTKEDQKGEKGEKAVSYAITEENGKQLERVASEEEITKEPVEEIKLNGSKELPAVGTGKFAWPAEGGYISSKRGQRWGRMHNGIDIAQPDGLAIKSADHGVVKAAGAAGTFGNRVVVDHQNGYESIYAHLSTIDVKVGETVPKGTKLGEMGNTGRSTGLHLHLEISLNGVTQNPLNYISS